MTFAPGPLGEDPQPGDGLQLKRRLLLAAGTACVGLGAAGVFLPLLPTTPFLLLAAYLLARSSPEHRQRLLSHRLLGPYVADWLDGRGVPRSAKAKALALLWAVLLPTSVLAAPARPGSILLLVVGAGVSAWIACLPARSGAAERPCGGPSRVGT